MASATRTHYDLLEVPSDADQAAIKAAYNKLRRPLHPDLPGGSATLFGMVAEAYEVLGDPQKRAEYDRYLAAGGDRGAHTKQATEAARATEAAHAAERTRLETLLRLAEAQAQGCPTPETGDAHADEVAQYVELLRPMDLSQPVSLSGSTVSPVAVVGIASVYGTDAMLTHRALAPLRTTAPRSPNGSPTSW